MTDIANNNEIILWIFVFDNPLKKSFDVTDHEVGDDILLRYIYGGKFSLKEFDNSIIIKIMIAANELNYFLDNDSKKPVPRIIEKNNKNKGYSKNIVSKIITFQHLKLISKWIDRLEITEKFATSCEFKLLYRDSRDGSSKLNNGYDKLRKICKNQSRTIVVIKAKDSNKILGGYNPIEWKFDNHYGNTKDSFVFSFSNNSIENYILSHVKNEEKAIYSGTYSVSLAFDFDLQLYSDSSDQFRVNCEKSSYEKHIGGINDLYVEEFEVFQIVIIYWSKWYGNLGVNDGTLSNLHNISTTFPQ
ncbi:carbohydrate-binding module family 13 protein [Rhizophagus irregularis DAOM 181602=DAOM 197198]|nr:carbohydrate-binding module family 13 protein [Rhizophagus irregularis DAOM 181602=DAOM 197198]